jgi:hypothetical protein
MTNNSTIRASIAEDRQGLKLASFLHLAAEELPHDVSERLRIARVQALAKRKVLKIRTAHDTVKNGSSAAMTWGQDDGLGWWGKIGSVAPLIALVVGLVLVNAAQDDNRARELAEVDAALLIDDLPPAAFADPGFLQFLKTSL